MQPSLDLRISKSKGVRIIAYSSKCLTLFFVNTSIFPHGSLATKFYFQILLLFFNTFNCGDYGFIFSQKKDGVTIHELTSTSLDNYIGSLSSRGNYIDMCYMGRIPLGTHLSIIFHIDVGWFFLLK